MKLSIITINYNNKNGLQKTIDSVISQTFKDFEWIIIDGGSTDGSKELIEKYSSYINYWISEPDKGIYNAMNKGIVQAKGEYLQFLNSGDALYTKTTLDELFKQNLYGDIIYGDVIFIKNDNSQELIRYNKPLSLSYFISGNVINHQASFIKRELFKEQLYNENLKLVSDWEFWILQAIKGSNFQYISQTIVLYDFTGLTSKISNFQKEENELVIKNTSWAIRKDIEELFFLRRKMEDGYIKTISYFSQKGNLQRKIINFTIHILHLIDFINNKLKKE